MYKNIGSISPICLSLDYEWKLFGTKIRKKSEEKEDMNSGKMGAVSRNHCQKSALLRGKKKGGGVRNKATMIQSL